MKTIVLLPLLLLFSVPVLAQSDSLDIEEDSLRMNELPEFTFTFEKEGVIKKPDRTIIELSKFPALNSGTLLEGLKKIPGLIVSDLTGMMYQGEFLEVYMDGRPLDIYSDELNAYLAGMPASAIEKIELITQPGAEFPATSGNAIINIVTARNPKNFLSLTYSNGYRYTRFSKDRFKFNNSVAVNAKNKGMTWNFRIGQSYADRLNLSEYKTPNVLISKNEQDRINRFYYGQAGVKFSFKKDRLLLDVNYDRGNNHAKILTYGEGFNLLSSSNTVSRKLAFTGTYFKRFKNDKQKLNFSASYSPSSSVFGLQNTNTTLALLDNTNSSTKFDFKTDFIQELDFLDGSKFVTGILLNNALFKTESFEQQNLVIDQMTHAGYAEFQTSSGGFDFILGSRVEAYDVQRDYDLEEISDFKQTRLFPNASIQYNIADQLYVKAHYSKKLSLPNFFQLNPNNVSFTNPNLDFLGNPNLNPSIYDQWEVRFSAYDYIFIGYSYTKVQDEVVRRVFQDNNTVFSLYQNIPDLDVYSFNVGLPIPYMLFTKGLKKTLELDYDPSEIDFLYVYLENKNFAIPSANSKGFWNLNLQSQLILFNKVNFTVEYNTLSAGGYFYYYKINKPLNHSLDFSLSSKFLKGDKLSVSIFMNDLLLTNKNDLSAVDTDVMVLSSFDSRMIGFNLNFKLDAKK